MSVERWFQITASREGEADTVERYPSLCVLRAYERCERLTAAGYIVRFHFILIETHRHDACWREPLQWLREASEILDRGDTLLAQAG